MNVIQLLEELDSYLALRQVPNELKVLNLSNGYTIIQYQVKGVEVRSNNRVSCITVQYYVYREGEAEEQAYFIGDPISGFWRNQVADYISAFNGVVIRANKPTAICRCLETAEQGEKFVLVTEDDPPGTFTHATTTLIEMTF